MLLLLPLYTVYDFLSTINVIFNTIYKTTQIGLRITFQVYDVLPARIRACVARPGLAKCGWREAWEWRSHDLADRNPVAARTGGGAYTVCYVKWGRTPLYFFYYLLHFFIGHIIKYFIPVMPYFFYCINNFFIFHK